ncbi:hypothetical protein RPMA_15080 [Tardiphaga alba]|uniref:Uncharacterized protein n=1 Tax=Tardiphaga alba TaxID=340268 RepID=A0ABX8A8L4_9BRAD|nr:hypothetical protein [Tardiphaga alba]QUS40003.1 hypothetical protein RPMA_15080 [Tardiphaga alba]
MTQNDPTDHALAAIASILDSKESSLSRIADAEPTDHHLHETVTVVAERVTVTVEQETVIAETDAPTTAPEPDFTPEPEPELPAIEHGEVDGYTRLGPGPLDAIRFRWTARRDEDGQYFVDETIGSHSRPISSGPMPRHEVVEFINAREGAARERFQSLKRQMTISRQMPETEPVSEN